MALTNRPRVRWVAIRAGLLLIALAGLQGCVEPSMTNGQWDQQVLKAQIPVLVEFFRPGCPGCAVLLPELAAMAADYEGRASFYTINTDTTYPLAAKNNVSRLPAVLLFVNGREVKRWEGVLDIDPYRQALDAALAGK